ncbi:MAG TPA: hypothetical protein V6D03_16445 [Candidatus Caenarcaniphilales bacterium]
MKLQDAQDHFAETSLGLILKVLAFSALFSVLIKFVGPSLAIPATTTNALIAVFLPPFLMGLVLVWRSWQQGRQS